MKVTPTHCMLFVLTVCVAVLTVCLLRNPDGGAAPARAAAPAPRAKVEASNPNEVPGAVERALRRRIRQLEAELAAARSPAAQTNDPTRAEAKPMPQPSDFRPPSPREMMENMKKNDPKRYEEFQRRFAEMRKRRLERTKGRLEYFSSIDTSGMSKAEKANHEKLQALLEQRENLPDVSEMSEEDARQVLRQRFELDRSIRAANEAERTALLKQTARAIGLEGEDASVLTSTIQEVLRATESDRHGPHGPPPPGS